MSEYLELTWSVEDTIENMRKLKELLQKMCITDNLDGKGEEDAKEVAFDFDRVIKALEKQISKKPIRNDKCTCPSCGTHNEVFKKRRNTVAHDIVYCWHCGQAVEIDRLEENL